jgi:hypothetical protein
VIASGDSASARPHGLEHLLHVLHRAGQMVGADVHPRRLTQQRVALDAGREQLVPIRTSRATA